MMQVPLTRIQKLIGKRMLASKHSKPCFYIEKKADVTNLLGQRHALSKSLGVKITSNTFLIRALGLAARLYPEVLGDSIRDIPITINVGFAVNSPQGLVVPVIKDADRKTLDEIASEERILTRHARSNKLTLRDIEGETIALSNLGAYGIDSFLGIPPLPTHVILSVGTPIRTVVPLDGDILIRKMMSLSLAVDQTVVTGPCAAEFLNAVVEHLETPNRMMLGETL